MPAVIVFPIDAKQGSQACPNGTWVKGRWEVFDAIKNSVILIKEDLGAAFQFQFSETHREHTVQKDLPECKGFSSFELIQPPKSLNWLPAMMVLHLENDSLYSATALDEIARLRQAGRAHLAKLGVCVENIPVTARALVFTNDLHLLPNHSSHVFVERVDVFAIRSWVTETCIIASFQDAAAVKVVDDLNLEELSWKTRRKFVKNFEKVLLHIWWEHVLSKESSRNIFNVLRERNGIVSRYRQLSELAEIFTEELKAREQRVTNVLILVLGVIAIALPLISI